MKLPKRITKLNENNESTEKNNESIEKQQSFLAFFYSPVIIGAVIFIFTAKPITKERVCITKIF